MRDIWRLAFSVWIRSTRSRSVMPVSSHVSHTRRRGLRDSGRTTSNNWKSTFLDNSSTLELSSPHSSAIILAFPDTEPVFILFPPPMSELLWNFFFLDIHTSKRLSGRSLRPCKLRPAPRSVSSFYQTRVRWLTACFLRPTTFPSK